MNHQATIRALLRRYDRDRDGLTVRELSALTNRDEEYVRKTLHRMPDAYIDRWWRSRFGGQPRAVWRVVVPPPHCPQPSRKKQ